MTNSPQVVQAYAACAQDANTIYPNSSPTPTHLCLLLLIQLLKRLPPLQHRRLPIQEPHLTHARSHVRWRALWELCWKATMWHLQCDQLYVTHAQNRRMPPGMQKRGRSMCMGAWHNAVARAAAPGWWLCICECLATMDLSGVDCYLPLEGECGPKHYSNDATTTTITTNNSSSTTVVAPVI
jgi:hypothetical protein